MEYTAPPISKIFPAGIEIHHLDDIDSFKLYKPIVLLGHALNELNNEQLFIRSIKEVMNSFPTVPALSPISDMDFPEGWQDLDYWS